MSIRLETNRSQQEKRILVFGELKKEIERIDNINKKERGDKSNFDEDVSPYERENDEEYREPLSIEKEEVFKILLSWGGGEDGFKLVFKNKEILRGVYYCADWGEYQEVELNEEELGKVFNFYLYGEYPDNLN